MIYRDVDPKAWSLKYGLKLETNRCRKCGMEVEVNIPIQSKDFVGFESKPHEPCGESYKIILLKPLDLEIRKLLEE